MLGFKVVALRGNLLLMHVIEEVAYYSRVPPP